jgi:integrase
MTATGQRTFAADTGLAPDRLVTPPCRFPERLAPLVEVASFFRCRMPASSSRKVKGSLRRWTTALQWWGLDEVSDVAVCAFVVLRCCPPLGVPLPDFAKHPVTPPTAANDVDALRRAARLNIGGAGVWREALESPRVSELLRALGARVKRLRTAKRPLLLREAEASLEEAIKSKDRVKIRDAFALVLALSFGLRCSELINLNDDDYAFVEDVVTLTIRSAKTRATVFTHHDPYRVSSASTLLLRAHKAYAKAVGSRKGCPLFRRLTGCTPDRLSKDWFRKVVKNASPECSPHSCRVGFATELRSAGASMASIMSLGRWSSAAALLYVLSVQDDHVRTSKRLGPSGLMLVDGVLRRDGTSLRATDIPRTDEAKWALSMTGYVSSESDNDDETAADSDDDVQPPRARKRTRR